jgi:hypothetical protein
VYEHARGSVVVDREKGEATMGKGRIEIGGHVIEVADSGNVYVDGELHCPEEPVETGNEDEHPCDCDDSDYCEAVEDNHLRLLDCAARACLLADVLGGENGAIDSQGRLKLFGYVITCDNEARLGEYIDSLCANNEAGESC